MQTITRIRIKKEFSAPIILNLKGKNGRVRMPYIDVVVHNPFPESKKDNPTTERFIVDSGASITILNSRFTELLKDTPPESETIIQYGQGKTSRLPVYRVVLKIQGYHLETVAAYDANLKTDSLLGHYGFFDTHFDIVTFDFKGRSPITKLIKG
jgi:hypothetical protein